MGAVIAFIPNFAVAAVKYFKADPRKAAHIVAAAIGYLTVSLEAVNAVVPKAIEVLRAVLTALTGV